jgi:hypothetical protein
MSRDGYNRIRVCEECTGHCGVLSFCHSYLVDSSSSKVLLVSHENRVGTSIGEWVGCQHQIGARMSIVALLSTVETLLFSWILQGVWSCLQPLHVVVFSSRSLKFAGVLDDLALWSCIALFNLWSLHRLTSHDRGLAILRVLDTLGSGNTSLSWLTLWASLWTLIYIMTLFTTPKANLVRKGY